MYHANTNQKKANVAIIISNLWWVFLQCQYNCLIFLLERDREKSLFIVPLIYAFIGCFYVPWLENP